MPASQQGLAERFDSTVGANTVPHAIRWQVPKAPTKAWSQNYLYQTVKLLLLAS